MVTIIVKEELTFVVQNVVFRTLHVSITLINLIKALVRKHYYYFHFMDEKLWLKIQIAYLADDSEGQHFGPGSAGQFFC